MHWALGNGQLPKYPLILTNCCEQWICAFLVRNNVFTAKLILSSGISVVYCRSCEAILIVEGREAKNLNLLKKTGKQGILHCIICGRCYIKKPGSLFSLVALAATMIEIIWKKILFLVLTKVFTTKMQKLILSSITYLTLLKFVWWSARNETMASWNKFQLFLWI